MDKANEFILEAYVMAYNNLSHFHTEMVERLNLSVFDTAIINKLLDFQKEQLEAQRELVEAGLTMKDVFAFMADREGDCVA